MTELEQLTQLCVRLGAPPVQAGIMAAQLLKRAEQISVERGIAREEALRELVEVVIKGRAGEVPVRFAPPGAKPKSEGAP